MDEELLVRPGSDGDGPRVRMDLRTPDPGRWTGRSYALALERVPGSGDPCLTLRELPGGARRFRSPALPGAVFMALAEVSKARGGEGLELAVVPAGGGGGEALALGRLDLDFTGAWARAREHEDAGRIPEALVEYRRSPAPGAAEAVARLEGRGVAARPVVPGLDDEAAVRMIVRAVLADGAVDPTERKVLAGLARFFELDRARLEALVREVAAEPRTPGGKPLVPEEVLRALLRRALDQGKIGPASSRVLNQAARALGLTRERILAMVRR